MFLVLAVVPIVFASAGAQRAATAVPLAQPQPPATPVAGGTIKSIRIEGAQRLEPETVLSYTKLRTGQAFTNETLDQDFIITYVVEEGKRYKFGDVTVDSDIRDFDNKKLAANLGIKKGDWYDAKKVENSVDSLSEAAGLFGYAFTEVNPDFQRDKDTLTMGINFHI
eukprot:gene25783-28060_t